MCKEVTTAKNENNNGQTEVCQTTTRISRTMFSGETSLKFIWIPEQLTFFSVSNIQLSRKQSSYQLWSKELEVSCSRNFFLQQQFPHKTGQNSSEVVQSKPVQTTSTPLRYQIHQHWWHLWKGNPIYRHPTRQLLSQTKGWLLMCQYQALQNTP